MNDREKVINKLEELLKDSRYSDSVGWNPYCDTEAFENAIALLKAQEPMKPIRYQQGRWFKTWRCGACGGTLVFRNGKDKPKYCTDCGKAVKWE